MDEVYPAIERATGNMPQDFEAVRAAAESIEKEQRLRQDAEPLKVDADEDRKPRTIDEMVEETEWLKGFFLDLPQED